MCRSILFCLLAGLAALVCPSTAWADPAAPAARACPAAMASRIQRAIDADRAQTQAAGMAAVYYDHGSTCLVVSGNTGDQRNDPITPDTEFAMGSVEKVFDSTLLARAIDGPAARYIVGLGGARAGPTAHSRKSRCANW